jgi:hypothetical protein
MPDFERLTRSLALHRAKSEQERRELAAYHRGQDRARWEFVVVVTVICVLLVLCLN